MDSSHKENIFKRIKKWASNHIGATVSLVWLTVTVVICFIAVIISDWLISQVRSSPFANGIDKVAILSINLGISVCAVTALTLSLSIEGSGNSLKFGLTPKMLNEYLSNRISLRSSFVALAIQFIASIVLLRFDNSPVFYTFTLLSLAYFTFMVVFGLPVLSGDHKKAFKRIVNDISSSEEQKKMFAIAIINHMFRKGRAINDIYESLDEYNHADNKLEVKQSLIESLSLFALDSENPSSLLRVQWPSIKKLTLKSKSLEENSFLYGCREAWFNCIWSFYKRAEFKEEVLDLIYSISLGSYNSSNENTDGTLFVEYIFMRAISVLLQTGDFRSIGLLKKSICKYVMNSFPYERPKLLFFALSFFVYMYYIDTKVPTYYKKQIPPMLAESGGEPRYENLSWTSMLNRMVCSKYSIDRNEFVKLVEKYEGFIEYQIFGIVYSPIMTRKNALVWYWIFLLLSSNNLSIDRFVDENNTEDNQYFEEFYKNIISGTINPYAKVLNVFLGGSNVHSILSFDRKLQNEIGRYINDRKKKELEQFYNENNIALANKLSELEQLLGNELKKCNVNGNPNGKTASSFTMTFYYSMFNSPDSNYGFLEYEISSRYKNELAAKMNATSLNKTSPNFQTVFPALHYRKKVFFANDRLRRVSSWINAPYCLKNVVNKASTFNSDLFIEATCIVSRLPYVGDICIKLNNPPLSQQDITAIENIYRTPSGLYNVNGALFTQSEFNSVVNKYWGKIEITIGYQSNFKNSIIIKII